MQTRNTPRSGVFVQNTLGDAPVNFRLSQQERRTRSRSIARDQGIFHMTDKGFNATHPCATNVRALEGLTGPFQGRFMIGHNNETLKVVDHMFSCFTLPLRSGQGGKSCLYAFTPLIHQRRDLIWAL
jgi:hypothetical protein